MLYNTPSLFFTLTLLLAGQASAQHRTVGRHRHPRAPRTQELDERLLPITATTTVVVPMTATRTVWVQPTGQIVLGDGNDGDDGGSGQSSQASSSSSVWSSAEASSSAGASASVTSAESEGVPTASASSSSGEASYTSAEFTDSSVSSLASSTYSDESTASSTFSSGGIPTYAASSSIPSLSESSSLFTDSMTLSASDSLTASAVSSSSYATASATASEESSSTSTSASSAAVTETWTDSESASATESASITETASVTHSATGSGSETGSASETLSASETMSESATASATESTTELASSFESSATASATASETESASETLSASETMSESATATATESTSELPSSFESSATASATASESESLPASATSSSSSIHNSSSVTATESSTVSESASETASLTASSTASLSANETAWETASATESESLSASETSSFTESATLTTTDSLSATETATSTTSLNFSTTATSSSSSASASSTSNLSTLGDTLMLGYYPDWAAVNLAPESVDWSRYDMLDFAFAVPASDGSLTWTQDDSGDILKRLVSTGHAAGKRVKLSIGGWTGSAYFSDIVDSSSSRSNFVSNIVEWYDTYELDGIDIDWEYPGTSGADGNAVSSSDSANFLLFLQELRSSLPSDAIITTATQVWPFADTDGNPMSDVSAFADVLDWILIMNYDVWGSSTTPGANAPLSDGCDNSTQPLANAYAAVASWTAAGMPAKQITLGVPAYGYLQESSATQLKDRRSLQSLPPHRRFLEASRRASYVTVQNEDGGTSDGQVMWDNLVSQGALELSGGQYIGAGGFTRYWDSCSSTPWIKSTSSGQIITYDDPESMNLKGQFAAQSGLRGCNVFSIDGDYMDSSSWPLTDAVRSGLGL